MKRGVEVMAKLNFDYVINNEKYLTVSYLKKVYGFTDKLIKVFLGDPDKYAGLDYMPDAPSIRLYKEKRVKEVMATNEFKEEYEKSLARKKLIKEGMANKKKKYGKVHNCNIDHLHDKLDKIIDQIDVIKLNISDDELRYIAINDYKKHMNAYSRNYDISDKNIIDYVVVEYILNNLTRYNRDLCKLKPISRRDKNYISMYRNGLFNKVAKAYPKYTTVAMIQICRR